MLKCKLSFQIFTYLGWGSSFKYLAGNQIEFFTLMYAHTHTHTYTHRYAHIYAHSHTPSGTQFI